MKARVELNDRSQTNDDSLDINDLPLSQSIMQQKTGKTTQRVVSNFP